MALTRRATQRVSGSIWPGFVDAMSALVMVLMFVLTIFMVVQYVLRDTISGQATKLDELSKQVAQLADALGLERKRSAGLEAEVGELTATLGESSALVDRQAVVIAQLTRTRDTQAAQIADLVAANRAQSEDLTRRAAQIDAFEAQVARLIAERDAARAQGQDLAARVEDLTAEKSSLLDREQALSLALAQARDEVDAATEQARLAAARREALEALVASLQLEILDRDAEIADAQDLRQQRDALQAQLDDAEAARLAEAAAAQLLRERLAESDDALTAMTLALEEQRRKAEETLTLLAAANAARDDLDARLADALNEKQAAEQAAQANLTRAEEQARLLAVAREALARQEQVSADAEGKLNRLSTQMAALQRQLAELQALLDAGDARDQAAQVEIEALGARLNTALARLAAEEKRRAELEEAERKRLEEEARQLERYRSEFFGQLRDLLAGREGVRIDGDRFVFSSEVLFPVGSAELSAKGKEQIARVAEILQDVADQIPPEIDWVLRVDGHTDNRQIRPGGEFADNWELSQARALSVVRYMIHDLGFDPKRLVAAGFGEFRPIAEGDSDEARAQNRRIELKLTER